MSTPEREAAFAAYRAYLCTLQSIQISPRLRAKLSHSDLVQQTLVDALREADALAAMSEEHRRRRLRVMLLHNLLEEINRFKTQRRNVALEIPLAEEADRSSANIGQWLPCPHPTPPALAEREERCEQMLKALAELPPEQSEAVILQHMHGWTLAEIGAHQGQTVGAVAGRVRRAMERLPAHLLDPE